ncbi:MAG TPA: hypothetical protein VH331_01145 [Allosphingosinicella sp.]|nr:hypothetical protein [Allosphingosinicella sp.]
MNRWAFVIAAYAIALIGTLALVGWSYAAMRRAERAAEALRTRE